MSVCVLCGFPAGTAPLCGSPAGSPPFWLGVPCGVPPLRSPTTALPPPGLLSFAQHHGASALYSTREAGGRGRGRRGGAAADYAHNFHLDVVVSRCRGIGPPSSGIVLGTVLSAADPRRPNLSKGGETELLLVKISG